MSQEPPTSNNEQTDWIERQLKELSEHTKGLDQNVLTLALTDYKKAVDNNVTVSPILTIVDFSKNSGTPRLWTLDLFHHRVLFHELVAHGKNSGTHELAKDFSNKHGSHKSSLGLFLTGQKYVGSRGPSLKLHGLNKGINDNAFPRGVVMHGANYVSEQRAKLKGHVGKSHGCFSVRHEVKHALIDTIKNGTLLYAYHPQLLAMA